MKIYGFRKAEIDVSDEKNMVIGSIMSTGFLARISSIYDKTLMNTKASVIVMEWVLDYYAKYSVAPGFTIQKLFEERAETLSPEDRSWVSDFLVERSKEFEDSFSINEEYLFDRTTAFFEKQFMRKVSKGVVSLLDAGRTAEAKELWKSERKEFGGLSPKNSLFDKQMLDRVYGETTARVKLSFKEMPLLHSMVGDLLSGWLTLFIGATGRGKTSMLVEVACNAMKDGHNVMFYTMESEVEDVVKKIYRNIFSMVDGATADVRFPKFMDKDTSMAINEIVDKRPSVNDRWVVGRSVKRLLESNKLKGRNVKMGDMCIQSFPSFSAGYSDITNDLDFRRIIHNFVPHVVIVDYAGIMVAPKGYIGRDVHDYNTKMLKRMAEERKVVMVSAIQGNRYSLDALNIRQKDIPEDIRQLNHVDVMLGLNQISDEKDSNKMRINVLKHRWKPFSLGRQVLVLQQLETAQFYLDDMWIKAPVNKEEISIEDNGE